MFAQSSLALSASRLNLWHNSALLTCRSWTPDMIWYESFACCLFFVRRMIEKILFWFVFGEYYFTTLIFSENANSWKTDYLHVPSPTIYYCACHPICSIPVSLFGLGFAVFCLPFDGYSQIAMPLWMSQAMEWKNLRGENQSHFIK